MGPVEAITVEVVYSPEPRITHRVPLTLPLGATVAHALERSGLLSLCCAQQPGALACSLWGHRCGLQQALTNHDRIELCRPLKTDPKEARRRRHAQQLAQTGKLRRPRKRTV
jgi:putative ubiquitin-RnfH superfamily antitoxin RatB of RatAB toxin-antitoxin module